MRGVNLLGINVYWQTIVIGAVLIIAVAAVPVFTSRDGFVALGLESAGAMVVHEERLPIEDNGGVFHARWKTERQFHELRIRRGRRIRARSTAKSSPPKAPNASSIAL